ncbi:undecaprenyl-phosphate alpha-N-acetylglucosaminyl 1-phosphate transferase [Paenibacillus sp. J31TS4]|uniref:MraY family glycosyltransferase n=1 Tax=Paenibacillus sp. J31TS4 TaxID=2807195 RepID=UPI001B250094|nr:MraY family glycosyltransferase [Paenibacillus sp. J31TS4]GIP38494.1 undecaprenyl-phosphate alpha-N-acetylglucosaminyl 1-phosphate transferase [Paenibacillus sp. J31TS4]
MLAALSIGGFGVALLLSLLLTPLVKGWALRFGAVALPNARSVHKRPMPSAGGAAMFAAFAAGFGAAVPLLGESLKLYAGLLAGAALMTVVGVLDDRYNLPARWKLLGQAAAASAAVLAGLHIELVNLPFGEAVMELQWLSGPLTVFWIVAVCNAVNLMDGLDGLAGGVSAIATAAVLAMAILMNNPPVVVLCAALLGSILGFLRYNKAPASIFMGDTGSLFLGYCLAALSVFGFKQVAFFSLISPLLIVGVPLADTLLAMVRRKRNKTPIFAADKGHLHHSLLGLGFDTKTTVRILYGSSALFGLCALGLSQDVLWLAVVVLVVVVLLLYLGAELVGAFSLPRKPLLTVLRRGYASYRRLRDKRRTVKGGPA